MYQAGQVFDQLLDRLQDMGAPPPRYGRLAGKHEVWVNVTLPGKRTVERRADTLDQAARAILDLDLTASDQDREQAQDLLA